MINSQERKNSNIYRVDKFMVPSSARIEFLEAVKKTHMFLRKQPGFIQDFTFEQFSGRSDYNFTTVVEWKSLDFVEKAKNEILYMHQRETNHPDEIIKRNNIKSEFSLCHSLSF